ncbi:unnamed protein product, partial [Discosporangium mesarthrocarpum]
MCLPGTEEVSRAYREPHRLLFFSIHLYDRVSRLDRGSMYGPSYEFFPGSGAGDDTARNIINAPLDPLWK